MKERSEETPLRKRAEKILSENHEAVKKASSSDMEKVVHELQVHQVEMEMQNDELRKAQQGIEESRSRYVDLYDFAPEGYFTLDGRGVIVEANLRGADLIGVERNLVLKTLFSLYIIPEDQELFSEYRRKIFQIPGRQSCELRLKRKGYDPLWVCLESVAVEDPDGKLTEVRLALSDITERKRAEEEVLRLNEELEAKVRERTAQLEAANKALREEIAGREQAEQEIRQSEREFRGIFEFSSVGMIERDASTGQRLHVNPRLCEMTGYSAEELLNQKDLILTHPDDRERDQKVKKGVLKGKSTNWASEKRYVRKDGEVIWVQVNGRLIRDSSGQPYRTVAVIQDITERKRAELALQESQALLQAVMTTTSDPVYVKNRQSCILMCNPALEKVAGKPAAEIIGRTDSAYYNDPIIGQALRENDLRVMESGCSLTTEEIAKTPDGYRTFISNKAPYRNQSGDIIGIIGISHDITERKKAEEELRKAKDELEMRVQERTEELAKSHSRLQNLSSQLLLAQEKERKRVAVELHDGLLSELSGVKYLVEARTMLLEKGKVPDLSDLKRISNILAVTIKETRAIMNNLHPSVLDELGLIAALNWLSGEYQESYPHIAVLKKIEVGERDITDSLKAVIYRVLQEALNNFAKHGKGDRVDLTLSKLESTLTLNIQDNGQGFDVEAAQKGLGLESMRERVELSGGNFHLESTIGQGTIIRAIWKPS